VRARGIYIIYMYTNESLCAYPRARIRRLGSKITISGRRAHSPIRRSRGLRFLSLRVYPERRSKLSLSISLSLIFPYNFGFSGNCTQNLFGRFYIYCRYNTRARSARIDIYIHSLLLAGGRVLLRCTYTHTHTYIYTLGKSLSAMVCRGSY